MAKNNVPYFGVSLSYKNQVQTLNKTLDKERNCEEHITSVLVFKRISFQANSAIFVIKLYKVPNKHCSYWTLKLPKCHLTLRHYANNGAGYVTLEDDAGFVVTVVCIRLGGVYVLWLPS